MTLGIDSVEMKVAATKDGWGLIKARIINVAHVGLGKVHTLVDLQFPEYLCSYYSDVCELRSLTESFVFFQPV